MGRYHGVCLSINLYASLLFYIDVTTVLPWIYDATVSYMVTMDQLTISWTCTPLTHWGRVTHICVSKLTTIDSDNGLSPSRRQAIIWTNAGILLIRTSGTNFIEMIIKIYTFSFKNMHLKMSSGKWQPSCLGLSVLIMSKLLKFVIFMWTLHAIFWVYACEALPRFLKQHIFLYLE